MTTQTSLTANQDIDYIQKDYNSTTDAIISFANVNYGPGTSANRLWTDFNVDSFSRNWLEIVAFISDVFYFYFDVQSTQTYLQTATVPSSIAKIAAQFGYTPATAASSSGLATFTFTNAGVINRGFRVASTSAIPYYLDTGIVAGSPGNYQGSVIQGTLTTDQFTAQGLQNEEFNLSANNVVLDLTNSNPLDISPQVSVDGNSYTLVTSFIDSNGTDTPAVTDSFGNVVGGGGRVFELNYRANGIPFVEFGDGTFGKKLNPNSIVTINYRVGGGSVGNIGAKTLTTLVDSSPIISAVINASAFSGGSDAQSIPQLQQLIPASLRTLDRAVAQQDYSDLLTANFPSILAAEAEQNTTNPGVDINVYVVPSASTVTNITDNPALLTNITNFLDRRKMVTTQFQILNAYGIDILISLKLYLSSTASQSAVSVSITTALQNYFNLQTGGNNGTGVAFAQQVLITDITNILETITGLARFDIVKLTYEPRIQNNVIGLTTAYNSSEVTIFSNVGEYEWLVGAAGTFTKTAGNVSFNNPSATLFTYNSTTGAVQYSFPVNIGGVSVGDIFRTGPGAPGALGIPEIDSVKTVGNSAGSYEVTTVNTVADQEGFSEITEVLTVADVSNSLNGAYFTIYDQSGSVGVWFQSSVSPATQPSSGAHRYIKVSYAESASAATIASDLQTAMNADSAFTAIVTSSAVQITLKQHLAVTTASDGIAMTGFTFVVMQQGKASISLNGKYFDLYDNVGPVRAWFNVSGLTYSPPAIPPGGRLVEVTINPNDSAVVVATDLQTAFNPDPSSKFTASVTGSIVTITDDNTGTRTAAADTGGTGFTIGVTTLGSASVLLANDGTSVGRYFDLYDNAGEVRVWYYSTTQADIAPATPPGGRLIQVTILDTDNANTVATKTAAALAADSQFVATTATGNVVTAVNTNVGVRTAPDAGNSNFTVLVSQVGNYTFDTSILGVDSANYTLYILPGLILSSPPVAGVGAGGSTRTTATSYSAFEVFQKTLASATNLSINSITDLDLDLSVLTGTATALTPTVLLDNSNIFIPGEYATSNYYLVDSSSNIWTITANTSNTITTSITAVNNASVSAVSSGAYKIVDNISGHQVVFNNDVFTIQYNSDTTIYVPGAEFSNIGTIGNTFEISKLQTNLGNLGVALTPVNYNSGTGVLQIGNNPNFTGLGPADYFIDNTGQIFNVTAVNNTISPVESYDPSNRNAAVTLAGINLDSKYAEGFKVPSTAIYSIASYYLQSFGNIAGNLIATIVNNSGGLPNLSDVVATSAPLSVSSLYQLNVSNDANFGQAIFDFPTSPTLTAGTQYHLVVSGDSNYSLTEEANVLKFTNSGRTAYTSSLIGGPPQYTAVITYSSAVVLSGISPGNYFQDGAGVLFRITTVDIGSYQITVITDGTAINTTLNPGAGNIIANNYTLVGVNTSSPSFANGELARYDGAAWSNSTQGPHPWGTEAGDPPFTGKIVAVFNIEGTKTITLNSNLTPVLGAGATFAPRYYDDNSEISFILGISEGLVTEADSSGNISTLLPSGFATVSGIPNSTIDNFVFRTSPYNGDIINLRANELPQINTSGINLELFNGVQ